MSVGVSGCRAGGERWQGMTSPFTRIISPKAVANGVSHCAELQQRLGHYRPQSCEGRYYRDIDSDTDTDTDRQTDRQIECMNLL